MTVFTSPGNIAFSILGLDVYYYGLFMGLAICLAVFISNYIANKFYHYDNLILDISPTVLLFGIIGARLYYCVLSGEYYFSHPLDILAIRNGGLAIHGAILGGVLGVWYSSKKYKLNIPEVCDIVAFSTPLAQSIARWGNFFNSEAFGYPTNLPWKLFIPVESRPIEYVNFEFFHPTYLYESVLDFGLFIGLLILLKNKTNYRHGFIAAIYLIGYSIIRIIVESFRVDAVQSIFGVPVPTIVSGIIILIAGLYLVKKK